MRRYLTSTACPQCRRPFDSPSPKMPEEWYTAFIMAIDDPMSETEGYGTPRPKWEPGMKGKMGAWRLHCTGPLFPPLALWGEKHQRARLRKLFAQWSKENYGHRVTLLEVLIREDGLILSVWCRQGKVRLEAGNKIQSYVTAMRKRSAHFKPHSRAKRARRG